MIFIDYIMYKQEFCVCLDHVKTINKFLYFCIFIIFDIIYLDPN